MADLAGETPDVLVVGGGPGGASTGFWLARNGVSVLVAEKKTYPREKTCGDGLTPRAVKQLLDMGFDFDLPEVHRIDGLRAYVGNLKLEMPWPEHTIYPNWGAVLRRADLDQEVASMAEREGATVAQRTEALPVVEQGRLMAVDLKHTSAGGDTEVTRVHPRVVVIADGSLSRFGRELGTARRRDYPYGMAVRAYYASTNSKDPMLESQLNILDRQGKELPGYGWIFPLGDGTINVGAGAVSTSKGWKDLNTSVLLEAFVAGLPEHWEVTQESRLTRPVGGKLPMAFSVGPKVGPNWLAVGDSAGAVNPFNGEGIDYAYETGRMAAGFISEALATGEFSRLQAYGQAIEDEYGDYHRVARTFLKLIGNPSAMRALTKVGIRSRPLMEWTLKVMANLLEPEEKGMAERVYFAIEKAVQAAPEPAMYT
jgi:geranylgeranyl reductase family protein